MTFKRDKSPSFQPLLAAEPISISFRNSAISRAAATGAILGDVKASAAPAMKFGVLGALFTAIVASAGTVGLTLLGHAFFVEAPKLILRPPPSPMPPPAPPTPPAPPGPVSFSLQSNTTQTPCSASSPICALTNLCSHSSARSHRVHRSHPSRRGLLRRQALHLCAQIKGLEPANFRPKFEFTRSHSCSSCSRAQPPAPTIASPKASRAPRQTATVANTPGATSVVALPSVATPRVASAANLYEGGDLGAEQARALGSRRNPEACSEGRLRDRTGQKSHSIRSRPTRLALEAREPSCALRNSPYYLQEHP
jgi:hypothetical protein